MIMPAFVLGNAIAAVLDAPYAKRDAAGAQRRLRAHRARQGAERNGVVVKHSLRNALLPIITLGALEFASLLCGGPHREVFTSPASAG